MRKIIKDNLKRIMALLLTVTMAVSSNTLVFADGYISEADEEARERESMFASQDYAKKLLTYLSLEYPEININPDASHSSNENKMANQKACSEIIIDGNKTFSGHPNLTDNMVQFRYLGNFGGSTGYDDNGQIIYGDTVKKLTIKNVDEIRNLYVPASVETLIIENTTLNCYKFDHDSPGFQSGMNPGDLSYCKNLKKLVIKNVKFGDNNKRGSAANRLPEITYDCPYETSYVLNLMNCTKLEELEIDVSFEEGAEDVTLAINGGSNLFEALKDDKCNISPAPGSGRGQVALYADPESKLAKHYSSSETVQFVNGQFKFWLEHAIQADKNKDGVISQDELDAIDNLVINNQTAHNAPQTSLSAFEELADISKLHGLKTLEIDFYDDGSVNANANRHILKGIDFPDSLENLTMKNIYWQKDTQTKSHANADIILTNLKKLELYNTEVKVGADDSCFNHPTRIELTDKNGALYSCIIEKTDVESIILTNNSNGAGIDHATGDEKQRIRFSAADCQNLKNIEFLGEGYAVEGSLDLSNDRLLEHIGEPNNDSTLWTVYGEFDSTYAPVNVSLNSCSSLGTICSEIVIDYDFINERDLNVQTMNTNFSDTHKLTIKRQPRISGERAGNVKISCDKDKWVYTTYNGKQGYVIEEGSSFPTIAVFANGQRIRTSGEGIHNSESQYTEDTDKWVNRWDLVMQPHGYSSNFGNLTFYTVDIVNGNKSLRRVFYGGASEPVYVEWDNQENVAASIITLPTVQDETGGYKLTGTMLSSTGIPGEVQLKLYVYEKNSDGTIKTAENGDKVKSYIGFQDIKVHKMPDSVELVNDGTARGSGTKDDPYIVGKNEELKLKARLKVNGAVDDARNYALRDIYWRIKEYDETPITTSDSDGYSLYTLNSATNAGIKVVRGTLNSGETDEQYDRRIDDTGYYNHRRFTFDTAKSKFKIVAQSPYKNNSDVITSEVYVVYNSNDKPGGEKPSGGNSGSKKPSGGNSGGSSSGSASGGSSGENNPAPATIPVYNTIPVGTFAPGAIPVYNTIPVGGFYPGAIPVYNTIPVGTFPVGTIPVYNTTLADIVNNPAVSTLGVPVIDSKNPGVYVMPDPSKNEVVYTASPADYTKKTIKVPDRISVNGKEMLVTKVDPGAFKNNVNVETIKLGKNIEVIGNGAFEGATNLKRITLGRNVKVIGDGAFKDCVSLTSITIPGNVTNVGVGVFEGCIKLKTVRIATKKLTSTGVAIGAFNGLTDSTTIRVPWSKFKPYKSLFEEKGINPTVKIKR